MRVRDRIVAISGGVLAAAVAALVVWKSLASPYDVPIEATNLDEMVYVESAFDRLDIAEPYWIDRFEVTEREWADYSRFSGVGDPLRNRAERRAPDYPMRHVDFFQASTFAAWHFKRLPTNAEWERASRGRGGASMPWGEGYLPAANTSEAWERRGYVGQGVTRVGVFARGRSAVGAFDMIGNVREWTSSGFREALRDPRFITDPDYDRDEDALSTRLDRLNLIPDPYVLSPRRLVVAFDELAPFREQGPDPLLDLLPVLVPSESYQRSDVTGLLIDDDQYFLTAFDYSQRVYLDDIAADPLRHQAVDPRLLAVVTIDERSVIEEFGGAVDADSQYVFRWSEPLDADEREAVARPIYAGRIADELTPTDWYELMPVLEASWKRELDAASADVALRLDLIRDWRERYPELVRMRRVEAIGEDWRIVRGGSFRTQIRSVDTVLEGLENAHGASWDLGFRCVVAQSEVDRQNRVIPLVLALGYRDPLNVIFRVRPAADALVDEGAAALPYLRHALGRAEPSWLRERLQSVIDRIEDQG